MRIRNIVHKGLRRLYRDGVSRGVPPESAEKLRKMLAYLESIAEMSELRALPIWKPHLLSGDRSGRWSFHVSRNWRLTFRVDVAEGEILDLDLEDYH